MQPDYLLFGEQTNRLILEKVTASMYDDWLPLFERPEVGKYLSMDEQLNQRQRCDEWFTKSLNRYKDRTGGMNALIHKETGKLVGKSGLLIQQIDGEEHLEVGYSILPEYWGKGYATEAAIFIKNKAFELGYDKDFGNQLISVIHEENKGSQQVAIRNGMNRFKEYPNYKEKPFFIYRQTRMEWVELLR